MKEFLDSVKEFENEYDTSVALKESKGITIPVILVIALICIGFTMIQGLIGGFGYTVTDLLIDASITEDGDLYVQELIVQKGNFNGYERDILYKNINYETSIYDGSEIELISIAAMKTNDDISFDTFNDSFETLINVEYASNGDINKYITYDLNYGYGYKMYSKSNNKKTVYKLTYLIKDVAIKHNDISEVYWQIIGSNFDHPIDNVEVRLTLPNIDPNLIAWAHGDVTGNFEYLYEDNSLIGVYVTVNDLEKNTPVDLRMLFSNDSLNDSVLKTNDASVYSSIITEENSLTNLIEKSETNIFKTAIYYGILVIMICLIIYIIIMWIYLYRKNNKTYKHKYYREIDKTYSIATIDYLMNKKITDNTLSAIILDLIHRNNITFEQLNKDNYNPEYAFHLKNTTNLSTNEFIIVHFLFETIGNGKSFTSFGLKSYARLSHKKYSSTFSAWKKRLLNEASKENFFIDSKKHNTNAFVLLVSVLILYIIIIFLDFSTPLIYILLILSFMFFIYANSILPRTEKGLEVYGKMLALKRFLLDFGTMPIKELPDIILWENYLVYATVFGIAESVEKSMNVRVQEFDPELKTFAGTSKGKYNGFTTFDTNKALYRSFDSSSYNVIRTFNNNYIMRSNRTNNSNNRIDSTPNNSNDRPSGGFSNTGGHGGGGGGGRGF